MSSPCVLVIYKKSTYDRYAAKSESRLQELLKSRDITVDGLLKEHEVHEATLAEAKKVLKQLGAKADFRRRLQPDDNKGWDMIVTLGGDGTLLWASHLADRSTPMVAINSSPETSVGYFSSGDAYNVGETLEAALSGKLNKAKLARMRVDVDDEKISGRVLNDLLFCHECPAATARYVIEHGGKKETQMSSGIWVGPAAGSTAAIHSAGGKVLPTGSQKIQFVVREPYSGKGDPYKIVKGMVSPGETLLLHCKMPEGMLYMDGSQKTKTVSLGGIVRMSLSDEPLLLLGLRRASDSSTRLSQSPPAR